MAGTTPVLSTRSSLFLFHMCCLENVRTVRLINDFRHFQLAPSKGKSFVSRTTASQTKSCMVLTRSMATTNNAQGDELRTTALERQVQTFVAVVECLTKQNHDLEEQLRQKNASLNTQEEDQE